MTKLSCKYLKRCFLAIPLSIFIFLCLAHMFDAKNDTCEYLILRSLGYQQISGWNILYLVLQTIIFFIELILFSSIIFDDLNSAMVYIFTRRNQRLVWYIYKFGTIIICTLLFNTFLFFSISLLGIISGFPIGNYATFLKIFVIFIASKGLTDIVYLLWSNILSMFFPIPRVMLFSWLLQTPLYVLSIRLIYMIGDWVVFLSPPIQGIVGLHDVPQIALQYGDIFEYWIPDFTIPYSVVYMLFLTIIVFFVGYLFIRKRDLL